MRNASIISAIVAIVMLTVAFFLTHQSGHELETRESESLFETVTIGGHQYIARHSYGVVHSESCEHPSHHYTMRVYASPSSRKTDFGFYFVFPDNHSVIFGEPEIIYTNDTEGETYVEVSPVGMHLFMPRE